MCCRVVCRVCFVGLLFVACFSPMRAGHPPEDWMLLFVVGCCSLMCLFCLFCLIPDLSEGKHIKQSMELFFTSFFLFLILEFEKKEEEEGGEGQLKVGSEVLSKPTEREHCPLPQ